MSNSSELLLFSKTGRDSDKNLLYHVNKYLSKSFIKLPRNIGNSGIPSDKGVIEKDYLSLFTDSVMIPTRIYFSYKSDLLRNLGNIWLNQYLQKLIIQHQQQQACSVFTELDLQIVSHFKSTLISQWHKQVEFIGDFYQNFQLFCPVCFENVPNFTPNCNVINLLISHDCKPISDSRPLHHCPCGSLFPTHQSFLNHILPTFNRRHKTLNLSACPIATFYWLITAVSSTDLSSDSLSLSSWCSMCSNLLPNNSTISDSKSFDFYSWLHHLVMECPSFLGYISQESANNICHFCPKTSLPPVKKFYNKDKILTKFNAEFNLNLFKFEDFFDFTLDFNLTQRMRPSEFFGEINFENLNFSKEELDKVDFLFCKLPYSCSKCLIRFNEIALKYNHSCYVPKGSNSSISTHICRCGNLNDNHLSFWNHIFDKCFILTYLYLIMFCLLKNINVVACFCKNFSTTQEFLGQLIHHWKRCEVAYHVFAKRCRYCYTDRRIGSSEPPRNVKIEAIKKDINQVSMEKPKVNYHSLCHSAMSLVVNRCQIFSPNSCNGFNSSSILDEYRFGILESIQLQEQAALIQPIFHLLENISVTTQRKSVFQVAHFTSTILHAEVAPIRRVILKTNERDKCDEINIIHDPVVMSTPDYLSLTMNYIHYPPSPIDVDIKFKKSVFNRNDCFGKIHSLLRVLTSKMKINTNPIKPVTVEYLEEPTENHERTKNIVSHYCEKILNMRRKKYRKKLRSCITMLPLFRKLPVIQYNNENEMWSSKNFQIQYLEPHAEVSLNSRRSSSGSELERYSDSALPFPQDILDDKFSNNFECFNTFDDNLNSFASV